MNELIAKIEQWAEDRNIIKGSKPIDQAMKLFSEFGELADNVGKGRDCRDDIGDVFVVLTIIGKQLEHDMIIPMADVVELFDKENNHHYGAVYNMACTPKEKVAYLCSDIAIMVNHFYDCRVDAYSTDDLIEFCLATIFALCDDLDYTLQECAQIAYNDIKDRKGVMYNGVFIKESDPAYQDALDNIEANKRMASQKRISVNIEDL